MKNYTKGFAPILLLILIAVVAIGGGYYYVHNKKSTDEVSQIPSTTTKSANKTYTNSQYGFSLEYPGDWRIGKGENRNDGEFAYCDKAFETADAQCSPVFTALVPDKSRGISLYILDATKVQQKIGIHTELSNIFWDKTHNRLYEFAYSDLSTNIPARDMDTVRADAFNRMIVSLKLQ
jgi:hypothetical protein